MDLKRGISNESRVGRQIRLSTLIGIAGLGLLVQSCDYIKVENPPDVDKATHQHQGRPTCWLATAANLLAAAGYGSGADVQQRADGIYLGMIPFSCKGDIGDQDTTCFIGHTPTALRMWLEKNATAANPYRLITVRGHLTVGQPWELSDGPIRIGNHLRACDFVGLSIIWPLAGSPVKGTGHAVAVWGDDKSDKAEKIEDNPSKIKVTDSDWDDGGDLQTYSYDDYENPNPGGLSNHGEGWYFNHGLKDPEHPYIRYFVTLSPVANPGGTEIPYWAIGSFRVKQSQSSPATGLQYDVGTEFGSTFQEYETEIDWTGEKSLTATPSPSGGWTSLNAKWSFADGVPQSTWVTITTSFAISQLEAVKYGPGLWQHLAGASSAAWPDLEWSVETPELTDPTGIPSITGGYLVGSILLLARTPVIGTRQLEFRFISEYPYTLDPERHTFRFKSRTPGTRITRVRFGHSYGILDRHGLWVFDDWITDQGGLADPLSSGQSYDVDWDGLLPYPQGEDLQFEIPWSIPMATPTPTS
jgi:hypothetical protein